MSGAAWLGIRSRAGRDAPMLVVLLGVVMLSAGVGVAGPALLNGALDAGLRDTVAAAGDDGQLEVHVPLDLEPGGAEAGSATVTGADLAATGEDLAKALPPELAAIRGPQLISARGVLMPVTAGPLPGPTGIRFGYLDGPGAGGQYVAGSAPVVDPHRRRQPGEAIPVAVTESMAAATGLRPGSRLHARPRFADQLDVVVTGVLRPRQPSAPIWAQLPTALRPGTATDSGTRTDLTLLLDGSALPTAGKPLAGSNSLTAVVQQSWDLDRLTAGQVSGLLRALDELTVQPPELRLPYAPETGLGRLLVSFQGRAGAVRAQLSVLVVGSVGVAVLLTFMAAGMLTERRRDDLALEYARGAALWLVAARAAAEAALVAVVGCGLAWALLLVAGGPTRMPSGIDLVPLVAVLVAAVLSPAGMAVQAARGDARGAVRRSGSRLSSRAARSRARGRRLVAEVLVLLVATGAVVSLRGRGVSTPGQFPSGVDPYLAAAPALLAVVAAVLAVRLQPWPVRALTALTRRGRGMVGFVATARAAGSPAAVPLLALTLAVGLATAGGLVRQTVLTGQETASWQRVGADVRATGRFTEQDAAALRRTPGVRQVVLLSRLGWVQLDPNLPTDEAELVAVDADRYAQLLAEQPLPGVEDARRLAAAGSAGRDGSVPVLAPAELRDRLATPGLRLSVGDRFHPLRLAGSTSREATAGWLSPQVVVVDARAVQRVSSKPLTPTVLLATGPAAAHAVSLLPGTNRGSVVSRAEWLSRTRNAGLGDQVLRLTWLAVLVTGLLAAAAVVAGVLAGARQRGRALAVLRTFGLRVRAGRALAVAELAPLVLLGALAGVLAGVGIVVLLGPALGLQVITGGLDQPAVSLDPRWAGALAAGVLVVFGLATVAELAVHRRERVADVIRTR